MRGLNRIAISGVVAGFIVASMSASGWAQPTPGHPPMGPSGMHHDRPAMGGKRSPGHPGMMFSPSFFQELGLSADQAAKFKRLRNEYKKEEIRRGADIKLAELDFWELVERPDATADQIEKKLREVEGKKTELRVFRFKQLANLKTILTPEQFEKFRSSAFAMFGGGRGDEMGYGSKGYGKHGRYGGKAHGGYGHGRHGAGGYPESSDEE